MAKKYYTSEVSHQILIALLKAHNIRRIIASPGSTNISFVASVQSDPYFEIFSSVDERSAGYMACGMAAESGEPVVLSCTGATASRNYLPPLTEAFYRKLPVLAVTSSQPFGRIGSYTPQILDRTSPPRDCVNISVHIPIIHDSPEDEWAYTVKMNEAILELRHNGGGPAHINLATEYSSDFSVKELPSVKVINRIETSSKTFPDIKADRAGIFIGAHGEFSNELTELIDAFCEQNNGVVFCSHTSNYRGKYKINPKLVPLSPRQGMDLMIHIGQTAPGMTLRPKEVWRVNPDGVVRDTFRKLRYVFQMSESEFFSRYVIHGGGGIGKSTEYYSSWCEDYDYVFSKIPEFPFSNLWIAQQTSNKLPANSVLHLGIDNSLRCWSFFDLTPGTRAYCNTGGYGIDGGVSALVGASLISPDKLFFGVIGDLAFFYDMNSIGNRHVSNNLRLLIINNGCGTQFKNYFSRAARFGDDANPFIAAMGHFANKSRDLLRHYAQDLGFEYLTASNKEEYLATLERFITPEHLDKPIFFEVFTDHQSESDALFAINNIDISDILPVSMKAKQTVKNMIGQDNINTIKKIIGRQ